jgi:hypothetical protein
MTTTVEALVLRREMRLQVALCRLHDGRLGAFCSDHDFSHRPCRFSCPAGWSSALYGLPNEEALISYAYQMALEGPR